MHASEWAVIQLVWDGSVNSETLWSPLLEKELAATPMGWMHCREREKCMKTGKGSIRLEARPAPCPELCCKVKMCRPSPDISRMHAAIWNSAHKAGKALRHAVASLHFVDDSFKSPFVTQLKWFHRSIEYKNYSWKYLSFLHWAVCLAGMMKHWVHLQKGTRWFLYECDFW